MRTSLLLCGVLLLQQASSIAVAGDSVRKPVRPLYKDPNAAIEARVADLLDKMTIEDKMAQLMQGSSM